MAPLCRAARADFTRTLELLVASTTTSSLPLHQELAGTEWTSTSTDHGGSRGFFAPVTVCPARVSLRFPVSRLTSDEPGVVPGSIIVFASCSWATTESLSVCHLCEFEVRLPQVIAAGLTSFDSSGGCVRRLVVYVYCALLCNSLSAVAKNEADKNGFPNWNLFRSNCNP
jgi:hypothetical protein